MAKATRHRFSKAQLEVISKAFEIATDIVGDYFQIRNFSDLSCPVELCTCMENIEGFGDTDALAQVRQVQYLTPRRHRGFPAYQITLMDPTILRIVKEGKSKIELFPLLIYILVHELVHVMRFSRHHVLVSEALPLRDVEEERVDQLSRELLQGKPIQGIEEVLIYFSKSSRFCRL
jgi:hypothetical protein